MIKRLLQYSYHYSSRVLERYDGRKLFRLYQAQLRVVILLNLRRFDSFDVNLLSIGDSFSFLEAVSCHFLLFVYLIHTECHRVCEDRFEFLELVIGHGLF